MKNDSLEVPSGVEGIVIDTEKFSRRMSLSDAERKIFEKDLKEAETRGNALVVETFLTMIAEIESVLGRKLSDEDGTPYRTNDDIKYLVDVAEQFRLDSITGSMRSEDAVSKVTKIYKTHLGALEATLDVRDRELNTMKRGDELRSGVLQMVKVYICLLYTSPSPRDRQKSRMPSSA